MSFGRLHFHISKCLQWFTAVKAVWYSLMRWFADAFIFKTNGRKSISFVLIDDFNREVHLGYALSNTESRCQNFRASAVVFVCFFQNKENV